MTHQQIQLVMSDIDGTILNDQHAVEAELKEVLKELRGKNIPFIFASARSPRGIYPIAEQLDILDNPVVCYNGALILKNANLSHYMPVFSQELDRKELSVLFAVVHKQFPGISLNVYSGVNWYIEKFDRWVQIEASITGEVPVEKNLDQLIQNGNVPVHKLLLIGTPEEVKELQEYCTYLQLANTTFTLSKENYLEVTHRNVSKEKALIELSKLYRVPLENTMTIGDNFNDIPMLSLAGIGVAMANAPEEVKKSARVTTLSNNENGVTEALKKFILNR